jgi:hypothetical protein
VRSGQSFTVIVPGEAATVGVTETLQPGLKLHKAECLDSDQDPFEPGSLGTLGGATLSFDAKPGGNYVCTFVNGAAMQPDAVVWIWKIMDADGDFDTPDEFPVGVGWDFSVGVTNGTASRPMVTTDEKGAASFRVTAFAKLEITEVDGSDLLGADCWDIMGEDPIHGGYTQDGPTLAFDTEPNGVYGCEFTNLGMGIKGETPGPNVVAPPTDTVGSTPGQSSESPPSFPIVLAGVTAGVLTLKLRKSHA